MLVRRRMFVVRTAAIVRMFRLVRQVVMVVRGMSRAERRMIVAEVRSQ